MDTSKELKENTDEEETLLVLDKQKKTIKAVSHILPDGTMKVITPTSKSKNRFINIDRNGDLFSNFFSNFMSQAQNPTRFSFFIVSKKAALEMATALGRVLQKTPKLMPLNEIRIPSLTNQKTLNNNSMETTEKKPENVEYRYNPEQVNWKSLAAMGLDKDRLEKMNLMETLLKGFKTNELVPLNLSLGNAVVRMDARLSLQPNDQGEIVVAMHGIRKEPNLNYPFFGHEFSPEDKENLLKTGNMGRVVDLYNQKSAQYHPSIISVDRMTNELVALRAEWIKIPDEIKGVKLDEQQKQTLMEGKPLYIEGMTSKKGEPFDATLQFHADKRYVEFSFDRSNALRQSQDNRQEFEAPKVVRDKELTPSQYAQFKEGQSVYVSGLIDKQGKEYQGYITFNKETGKTGFSFKNPDKASENIKPSESHKTQVAVNSEGKTNEATKNLKEPLNTAQIQPETQQDQAVAKKGRKM